MAYNGGMKTKILTSGNQLQNTYRFRATYSNNTFNNQQGPDFDDLKISEK
jgi:hypothetical protein